MILSLSRFNLTFEVKKFPSVDLTLLVSPMAVYLARKVAEGHVSLLLPYKELINFICTKKEKKKIINIYSYQTNEYLTND